jgi:hypothetical protein
LITYTAIQISNNTQQLNKHSHKGLSRPSKITLKTTSNANIYIFQQSHKYQNP